MYKIDLATCYVRMTRNLIFKLQFYKYHGYSITRSFNLYHQYKNQGGRGHWDVYYTSPQSLIMFFYSLA